MKTQDRISQSIHVANYVAILDEVTRFNSGTGGRIVERDEDLRIDYIVPGLTHADLDFIHALREALPPSWGVRVEPRRDRVNDCDAIAVVIYCTAI